MIIKEIFYGLTCDRCEEIYDDGEHSFWNDEGTAEENAGESEWMITEKGKHYCPNCHVYNEEKDDFVELPEFPQHIKDLKKFLQKMVVGYSFSIETLQDRFLLTKSLHNKTQLDLAELNYITHMLDDNLLSIEYKKHERYSKHDVLIQVK